MMNLMTINLIMINLMTNLLKIKDCILIIIIIIMIIIMMIIIIIIITKD